MAWAQLLYEIFREAENVAAQDAAVLHRPPELTVLRLLKVPTVPPLLDHRIAVSKRRTRSRFAKPCRVPLYYWSIHYGCSIGGRLNWVPP